MDLFGGFFGGFLFANFSVDFLADFPWILLEIAGGFFLKPAQTLYNKGIERCSPKNSWEIPTQFSLLVGSLLFSGCTGLTRQSEPPPSPPDFWSDWKACHHANAKRYAGLLILLCLLSHQLRRCSRATPSCYAQQGSTYWRLGFCLHFQSLEKKEQRAKSQKIHHIFALLMFGDQKLAILKTIRFDTPLGFAEFVHEATNVPRILTTRFALRFARQFDHMQRPNLTAFCTLRKSIHEKLYNLRRHQLLRAKRTCTTIGPAWQLAGPAQCALRAVGNTVSAEIIAKSICPALTYVIHILHVFVDMTSPRAIYAILLGHAQDTENCILQILIRIRGQISNIRCNICEKFPTNFGVYPVSANTSLINSK